MRIALGCDHAGYKLKLLVIDHLTTAGHEIVDVGTDSEEPVDYPRFCADAARVAVRGDADLANVNKVHGARAALCHDETTARLAREHNDANVLSLGGRLLGETLALAIVDVFLTTAWEGGRHAARVQQLRDIEAEECAK